MILLVFHGSSYNFQSVTGKPTICESSHIFFLQKSCSRIKTNFLTFPVHVEIVFCDQN
ncbi:hypothetical protein GS518_13840 [Leptospira interrogans]|uniref:Uncharacterized protein n=1 Tax=Leptospira interrogans serovar Copenhageni str. LT2050 TaxID=1001598 RepID=M3HQS9_LEPIT|nr:hypothetical protein LEP1GSC150_0320 [Leptospira interrogans serovar Copenhageni str. LT2050]MTY94922.1 hypothetical protein [Leptospira interrogans serovar Copenhageni]QHH29326.1 hypothetical protein GS520_13840 [Leptospira interrogans]QHH32978.1 hypothetical protein GS525_13860 [Leptospira interrogans]QHH36600.1 hypothetical protein GS519_13830 [Leptospira interrogans]